MKQLGFQNLGYINLTVLYLTFAIMSLFAVPITIKFGTSTTLVLSAFTYAVWVAAFVLPAYKFENETDSVTDESIYSVSIISAALIGAGAGPLWVSNSNYLQDCSTNANKGRYNGVFFCIFMMANIFGGLFSGLLIESFSKVTLYSTLAVICFTSCLLFACLSDPVKSSESELELAKIKPIHSSDDQSIPQNEE